MPKRQKVGQSVGQMSQITFHIGTSLKLEHRIKKLQNVLMFLRTSYFVGIIKTVVQ